MISKKIIGRRAEKYKSDNNRVNCSIKIDTELVSMLENQQAKALNKQFTGDFVSVKNNDN